MADLGNLQVKSQEQHIFEIFNQRPTAMPLIFRPCYPLPSNTETGLKGTKPTDANANDNTFYLLFHQEMIVNWLTAAMVKGAALEKWFALPVQKRCATLASVELRARICGRFRLGAGHELGGTNLLAVLGNGAPRLSPSSDELGRTPGAAEFIHSGRAGPYLPV